jgi:hypothetical protein
MITRLKAMFLLCGGDLTDIQNDSLYESFQNQKKQEDLKLEENFLLQNSLQNKEKIDSKTLRQKQLDCEKMEDA